MKKPGVMRDFFLLLVIGLVFFLPACAVGAKFLAAGNKEKNSYANFLATIESMKDQPDGTAETHTLYLDSGTGIFIFPEGSSQVLLEQTGSGILDAKFSKPDKCEGATSCICKCNKLKIRDDGWSAGVHKTLLCEEEPYCSTFEYKITGTCMIQDAPNEWECKQGVFIGRDIKFGSGLVFEGKKARVLRIEKTSSAVAVRES